MAELNVELLPCSRCNEEKTIDNFSRTPAGNPRGTCKACRSEMNRGMHKRERYLKRVYNITHTEYVEMLEEQGGACAICGDLAINQHHGVLDVDHNHTTGKVRGLLCNPCNRFIGMAGDNTDRLMQAVQYLLDRGTYSGRIKS